MIRLRVASVLAYEDNPRQASNAKCRKFRSIRSRRLDQQLTVANGGQSQSHPGAWRTHPAHGLAELASQGDERFEQMDFWWCPTSPTRDLLAAHMVEEPLAPGHGVVGIRAGFCSGKSINGVRQITLPLRLCSRALKL